MVWDLLRVGIAFRPVSKVLCATSKGIKDFRPVSLHKEGNVSIQYSLLLEINAALIDVSFLLVKEA